MANTLTNLFPDLYAALDVVSREMIGFIPAVARDSSSERAALNQTIRVPIVPAASAADITPSTNAPDTGDVTVDNVEMTISKSRGVPVRWSGEEERGLNTAGTQGSIVQQRFAQAMRTLANEVEADLAGLYKKASRAFGTAGTTPFGTINELDDAAEVLRILEDNGAPKGDIHLVLDSAATAKLRGIQAPLFRVNEAGDGGGLLRRGIIGDMFGMQFHHSAEVDLHTKGTGSSYLLNDASSAVGDTTIATDTGSGTIVAGDVVTFAGTTDKYVVTTALAGGNFVIGAPGLRVAETDDDAITVGNGYRANMAFSRNAIQLVTRVPAVPSVGDSAVDSTILTDPVSGLSIEVREYREHRRVHYQVALAWGFELIKPEHVAILLG